MIERTGNVERLEERRVHLVASVVKVMVQKGFHRTTIRDMASAARWSMGQLYFYVRRKEDVLFLIAEDIMEDLFGSLQAPAPRETITETLRETVDHFFDACHRRQSEIQLLYRETASMLPEHQEQIKEYELRQRNVFAELLREGIDAGEFCPVHIEIFAEIILILSHAWILKGWALRDLTTFEEFKAAQLDLIFSQLISSTSPAHELSKRV